MKNIKIHRIKRFLVTIFKGKLINLIEKIQEGTLVTRDQLLETGSRPT